MRWIDYRHHRFEMGTTRGSFDADLLVIAWAPISIPTRHPA
jgi:hypothetical protein